MTHGCSAGDTAGMFTRIFTPSRTPPAVDDDPLSHPDIARMSMRELADLPFPREAPVPPAADRLCPEGTPNG
jgi:hypothetical protein